MNENTNVKKDKGIFSGRNIFIVQTIVALVVVFFVYKLGILPMKFLMMGLGALILVNALVGVMLFKTKGGLLNFSKILSLLLSLGMALSVKYIAEGDRFVSNVTGATKDSHVIQVVALKDSEYNRIEDVNGLIFGANTTQDANNIQKAQELIEKQYKFQPELKEVTSYEELAANLFDKEVPVILMSESHRSILEQIDEQFAEKTKVLGYVFYDSDVKVEKPQVNTKQETYSIFITGLDTYGPVSTVSRSDVNMIMTVNPNENQILLTSIPRDYHVELGTIGAYDKLTHAGVYGVGESVATLEKLLDMKIDYYIRVNFSSVETIVDALGGVDVYSQYSFTSLHGGFNFTKGMNHMDGAQSLGFVRERYSLPNGDNDRVVNQQELIKGIINKGMSPKFLLNFNSILNSVSDSVEMSIPDNDLKSIVKQQLDSGASWDIQSYSLSGYGNHSTSTYSMPGYNLYVMDPNYDTVDYASSLIRQMENNERISVGN